jgi:hypothetical protein
MPTKKKKSKKKNPSVHHSTGTVHQNNSHASDAQTDFWNIDEECAYYANLGE